MRCGIPADSACILADNGLFRIEESPALPFSTTTLTPRISMPNSMFSWSVRYVDATMLEMFDHANRNNLSNILTASNWRQLPI